MGTAAALERAGGAADPAELLALDIAFHRSVLANSGNEMFAALDGVVAAVLTGRTEQGLVPPRPAPRALTLHTGLARAVRAGEAGVAEAAMRTLTAEAAVAMGVAP